MAAASVNNIAATFATGCGVSPSGSIPSSPPSSTHSICSSVLSSSASSLSSASSSSSSSSNPVSVRSISASWNPHRALPSSHKSSLLTLYGLPGPRPHLSAVVSSTHRPRRPPRGSGAAAATPLSMSLPVISVGDRLPSATLSYLDKKGSLCSLTVPEFTRGKKSIIMGVSGAFPPPMGPRRNGSVTAATVIKRAGEVRKKVDVVACVSTNDVHVMKAWGDHLGAGDAGVLMLTDPNAEFARGLGLAVDLSSGLDGFGIRSEDYCMVAVNGMVRGLFLNPQQDNGRSKEATAAVAARFDDLLKVL